ncbi:hypothetical protein E2K93_09930 [Thalassotalea sp. HSM 43]|uniref:hypothetical protein n=1 Tax=Thalassotalea sp. HSM 43 TaxID=2552945 RepID=UPI001081E1BE|nr:hypothetical protein [Thalassotalea sp. HSM 43]QBY04689.1 hypothetical protein E2K93_09930 [Thalassotalea sp. HSM 43]
MKYTMTFGMIHKVANNIVEIFLDENSVFNIETYKEYREFINQNFEKPYGVIINQVNKADFDNDVVTPIVKNEDVAGIASVTYWRENERVAKRFIKLAQDHRLPMRTFSAYQLGRMKARQWLELEILKQSENV